MEALYSKLYYHLQVSKRTKLFNDRLNHCIDLMQILNQHLNDKKHTRLEWIIIFLIAIEAGAALGIFSLAKDVIDTLYEYATSTKKWRYLTPAASLEIVLYNLIDSVFTVLLLVYFMNIGINEIFK